MKKLQLVLLGLAISVMSFAQTHVTGTIDSETWTLSGSPYIIDADLFIANLTIEPGVTVKSNGDYVVEVAGILNAIGTIDDSISFTTTDTIDGWQGIFFNVSTFESALKYCKIENATNSGIRIINSTPVIENCVFLNNTAPEGGAIYLFNDSETGSEFTFSDCRFIKNISSGHGAALSISLQDGHAFFINSIFEENLSNPNSSSGNFVGGAIFLTIGDMTILNSSFIGNRSNSRCSNTFDCGVTARGGAIYLGSTGEVSIENSIFLENQTNAQNNGNCFFGGSSKSQGGAIYVNSGTVSLLNNIFAYNRTTRTNCGASTGGGGVYVNGGNVTMANCVVANNPDATGIQCVGDSIEVENSIIFFNNQESTQVAGKCKINYSNIQDGVVGEGNISRNPVFVKDDSTFHLTSISPSIDAGNPDEMYQDACFPPSLGDGRNDMGAYGGPKACAWLNKTIVVENDLGIKWINPVGNPQCGMGKEEPITIQVNNYGKYAVSNFEVEYSIDNGKNSVSEIVYKTIYSGDSLTYVFRTKANMASKGSYNCLAIVDIIYDINDTNDVVTLTSENDRLSFEILTTDTKCGEAEGFAEALNIVGRQEPYNFYWTSGDTLTKAEKLESGVYFVTISDALECSWTESFTINDIGAPEISMDSEINSISCFGMNDGSIDIVPIGGVQPYNFIWSNGARSQNIQELRKGQYDVTITDNEGCAKNHSFLIEEPAPLKIKAAGLDAECGEINGSALLAATGGTQPYSYKWNSSPTSNTVSNLAGGLYTAIVTDSKGCIDFSTVSINEINAPQIIVTSIVPASCGLGDGAINISIADESLQYNYSWSDGSTSQDMQNATAGSYSVTISDQDEDCSTGQIIEIPTKYPPSGEICMVTVDSISDGNIIVLKDPVKPGEISSTNVYLLSKTGTYQYLNTLNPSQTNTTSDAASNTEVTSYRYRITQVDGCGNESEPSAFHETMHVVVSPDFSLHRANLFWNSYKGIDYDFFQIYRYSETSGLAIIDTVPRITNRNFYTYTDLNPPQDDSVQYVIVIELPESCSSTKKVGTHNTLRSNKSKKVKVNEESSSSIEDLNSLCTLNIYPNPNHGILNVTIDLVKEQDALLRIYDAQGKMINAERFENISGNIEKKITLPNISPGIYHVQLLMIDGILSRSFIVE